MVAVASSQEQSTRRAILKFLKIHEASEVKAIANFCGLTAMAVRRHLSHLSADRLIQSRTERRPRGRPANVYLLTGAGDAHCSYVIERKNRTRAGGRRT